MLIDIHTHFVPRGFPAAPRPDCCVWPSLRPNGEGAMLSMGKAQRQLDARSWDVETRLEAMDAEGTGMHVLSPMPDLLGYGLPPADALLLARHINAALAETVARAPDRLIGLGTLPLHDIALSVAELPRLRDDLGLVGIEAGSFIAGENLGSQRFFPLFAALEALGMALFVHPVRGPAPSPDVGIPAPLSLNLVDYPLSQGLCVSAFLGNDVAARFPGLRVAFAHGGGAFPAILPRLQVGWERDAGAKAAFSSSPAAMARAFYFDSLVYTAANLRALVDTVGAACVCVGSDEPYAIRQSMPAAFIAGIGLSAGETDAVLQGNARRFLGMTQ